jgi:predicted amidophosphoribosyltransferase
MSVENRRMNRERKTIRAMVRIYCRGEHHTRKGLCADCAELLNYAELRLDKCPYQENKTTCANCPIHCYKPDKREQVRTVMRYAGPRMLWRHPVLALHHLMEGRKKEPVGGRRPRRTS